MPGEPVLADLDLQADNALALTLALAALFDGGGRGRSSTVTLSQPHDRARTVSGEPL
jgi:hypothetical protein